MFKLFSTVRAALFVCMCGLIASCNQTNSGVSTFAGDLSADSNKTKIEASRKRAAKLRAKKKEAFAAKRKEARLKRRSRFKTSGKSKTTVTSKRGSKKLRRVVKKRSRKSTKSRSRSIKGTRYAYVAGRSRGIRTSNKPWKCVPHRLKVVLRQVSKKFGRVVINSTHRSRRHNRLVGGKRSSYHLRCQAVDFRVHGRTRGLTRWLARHPYVGGYNRYPSGYYHIDTGPKRTW